MLIRGQVDHLKKSAAVATKNELYFLAKKRSKEGRTSARNTHILLHPTHSHVLKRTIFLQLLFAMMTTPTLFLSSPRITRKRQSWPALRFEKPVSSSIFVFAPPRLFHQMIEINDFFRGLFGDHAKEMQTRDSFAR